MIARSWMDHHREVWSFDQRTSILLLEIDGCCKIADLFPIGETIPIRLFLGGFDLTPTFREVNKKYSTRYYLSLVLIDEGKKTYSSCCSSLWADTWHEHDYVIPTQYQKRSGMIRTVYLSLHPSVIGLN